MIPRCPVTPGTLLAYNVGSVRGLESLHITVES